MASRAGWKVRLWISDSQFVAKRMAANLTKNWFGAKKIKKAAIDVERAPERTDVPMRPNKRVTKSARAFPWECI